MCTKLPKQAAIALGVSSLALFIMAIIEYSFVSQLGENPLLAIIKETAFMKLAENKDSDYEALIKDGVGLSPFQAAGVAFATLTLTAVIFAGVTALCATRICPRNKLVKCIAVIWITIACLFFLGIGIALLAVGSAFALPDYKTIFHENCKMIKEDKMDQIYPTQAQDMFQIFAEVDEKFADVINPTMCGEYCICDGDTSDKWYLKYQSMKKELPNYGRQFTRPTPYNPKKDDPYFTWTMGDAEMEKFASDSVQDCGANFDKNMQKKAAYDAKQAKLDGKAGADKQLAKDLKKYQDMSPDIKKAQPTKALSNFLTFIEDKFQCAGICEPPLFYFSKSITAGPPKKACLEPMVEFMSPDLTQLGQILIVSGVLILLMIFCALPICCLKNEAFKDYVGEESDEEEDVGGDYKIVSS